MTFTLPDLPQLLEKNVDFSLFSGYFAELTVEQPIALRSPSEEAEFNIGPGKNGNLNIFILLK